MTCVQYLTRIMVRHAVCMQFCIHVSAASFLFYLYECKTDNRTGFTDNRRRHVRLPFAYLLCACLSHDRRTDARLLQNMTDVRSLSTRERASIKNALPVSFPARSRSNSKKHRCPVTGCIIAVCGGWPLWPI